jgi:hypothetical protein
LPERTDPSGRQDRSRREASGVGAAVVDSHESWSATGRRITAVPPPRRGKTALDHNPTSQSRANQDIRRHPAAVGAAASRSPARLLLSTLASGRVEVAAMCSSLPSPSSHMAPWNWKLVLCLSLQAAVEAAAAGDQRENVMGQKRHGRSAHGPRDLIVFNFVIYILCTLGFPFADDS